MHPPCLTLDQTDAIDDGLREQNRNPNPKGHRGYHKEYTLHFPCVGLSPSLEVVLSSLSGHLVSPLAPFGTLFWHRPGSSIFCPPGPLFLLVLFGLLLPVLELQFGPLRYELCAKGDPAGHRFLAPLQGSEVSIAQEHQINSIWKEPGGVPWAYLVPLVQGRT